MIMRTSSAKFASIALALAALLAAAGLGPHALGGDGPRRSGPAPEFAGMSTWLNSPPLTVAGLEGKVVLVQFWTYTCINWMRTLPYVRRWDEMYRDKGLVVVGVHTPEFTFEHETGNVEAAIKRFAITYPVVQDNQYATWKAYGNHWWPAQYLIDKSGRIVATQFGEGHYWQQENTIARLVGASLSTRADDPDLSAIESPEMYFGTDKNDDAIVSAQSPRSGERLYTAPDDVPLNRFALSGTWKLSWENATLTADGGEIVLRFSAPKVNLIAGSPSSQALSIMVDGKPQPPVTVQGSQLYSLYSGSAGEHVLRVMIPKAGLSAYNFTFG
jgi:thiol-disulfide isomerase/thioredoxin